MRVASTPILKTAVVYGLLAVAHALPTSLNLGDDERRSLGRRAITPPLKPVVHPDPVAPVHPVDPARPPAEGPDVPGGLRPGTGDPVHVPGNSPEDVRLGETPKKTTVTVGTDNINALNAKLSEKPPTSKDFADYNTKIEKYTVDEYLVEEHMKPEHSPEARNWYNENGVPVGDGKLDKGPELKGIDVYGKKNVDLDNLDIEAAWTAKVDSTNGVMTRNGEFRTGKAGQYDSENYYSNIPVNKRIYISEHIAKAWKDNAPGQAMKKNVVTGIINEEMKDFLNGVVKSEGNPVKISPNDSEWPTIMGGSVGSPLARALTDHPDVFQNHKPIDVTIFKDGDGDAGMLNAIFTLGPAA